MISSRLINPYQNKMKKSKWIECTEELTSDTSVTILPCRHIFAKQCAHNHTNRSRNEVEIYHKLLIIIYVTYNMSL